MGASLFLGGVALLIHAIARNSSIAIPTLVFAVYSVKIRILLVLFNLKYQFITVQTVTQLVLFTAMFVFLILGLWITPFSARGHLTRQNINYFSVLSFKQKE
jgi:hypothetical protein